MSAPGSDIGTAAEDDRLEAAALRKALDLHPAQVSDEELARELGVDPDRFEQRDAVDRAIRELVAAGLLHRNGSFVFPSRAAVRFAELLEP